MGGNVLGLIPARGGSKGIPGKNIAALGGKPLIYYTISAALQSGVIDRLVVSTDSFEIANIAMRLGAEAPFMRPEELALDESPTIDSVLHVLTELDRRRELPDSVILLQPTSPFRRADHIRDAMEMFNACVETNRSLVSVQAVPHNFNPECLMQLNDSGFVDCYKSEPNGSLRRQNKLQYFARNGAAIYIFRAQSCLRERQILTGTVIPFVMGKYVSLDIDEPSDLYLAELLLRSNVNDWPT